jgi:hypothetical protein
MATDDDEGQSGAEGEIYAGENDGGRAGELGAESREWGE